MFLDVDDYYQLSRDVPLLVDMNGDGNMDICGRATSGIFCAVNLGNDPNGTPMFQVLVKAIAFTVGRDSTKVHGFLTGIRSAIGLSETSFMPQFGSDSINRY